MSIGPRLSAIVAMAILLCSTVACVQTSGAESSSSTVNIDDALGNAGLPPDISIVKYNNISTVTLVDPILVVKGSGLDPLEQQVFAALSEKYQMNTSYLVGDNTHTFDGQDIQNYDIIAIGGPLHNAFSALELSHGILKVNVVHVKDTGLVVESERMPTGRTLLVVASFASYQYVDPPGTTTVPDRPGSGGTGGEGGGTGGNTNPTPTLEIATITPLPDNLHATALATVKPGSGQNTDHSIDTSGDNLIHDLEHPALQYPATSEQSQSQEINPETNDVITDMHSANGELVHEQQLINQIKIDSEMIQAMSNSIIQEQNTAHEIINEMTP